MATCLREAAPAKAGNAAGDFFQQTQRLIWPLFVQEGKGPVTPIASMPGCASWTLDQLTIRIQEAAQAGLAGIALFPVVPDHLKDVAKV